MLLEVLKKSHMSSGNGSTAQTRVSAPRSKAVSFGKNPVGKRPPASRLKILRNIGKLKFRADTLLVGTAGRTFVRKMNKCSVKIKKKNRTFVRFYQDLTYFFGFLCSIKSSFNFLSPIVMPISLFSFKISTFS